MLVCKLSWDFLDLLLPEGGEDGAGIIMAAYFVFSTNKSYKFKISIQLLTLSVVLIVWRINILFTARVSRKNAS